METIKSTIAENFGGAAHAVAGEENQFDINKDVPDLSGKVALITGGSEGIGYATAHTLLKANLEKIFIVSMSEDVIDNGMLQFFPKLGLEWLSRPRVCEQCMVSSHRYSPRALHNSLDQLLFNGDLIDATSPHFL